MSISQSIYTEFDKSVELDGYALGDDRSPVSITVNTVKSGTRLVTDQMSRRKITGETNSIIYDVAKRIMKNNYVDTEANSSDTSPDLTELSSMDQHPSLLTAFSPHNLNGLNGSSYINDQFIGEFSPNIFLSNLRSQKIDHSVYIDWSTKIEESTCHLQIFEIIDHFGNNKIASRLRHLHATAQDDDPDDPEMNILSLRNYSKFLVRYDISLPEPSIVIINRHGFLKSEWYSNNEAAILVFKPNGSIVFAATSSDTERDDESQDIHGTGSLELAIRAVLPFIQ
ncbi:MAG: hypothetical protein OXE59_11955 [Bacteroidetes bacterium]|nr:hypothetical protein [Bacteroidota bacterium]